MNRLALAATAAATAILCLSAGTALAKPAPGASKRPAPQAGKTAPARRGAYHRVDIRFDLPDVSGNPFDFTENDVLAAIRRPDGKTVRLPAFFDGGHTWRVRYTPDRPGRYTLTGITRNGKPVHPARLAPSSFEVRGTAGPGFVRRDPKDPRRFILDDGHGFYPIGHNVAWGDGKSVTVTGVLAKMGKAGENWARIWMDHWDGKNLDWVPKTTIPIGTLDLGVARHWDGIVEAAEKSGVRFQMVLQHHGPYSTGTDSNWADNPWNVANGGFLSAPEEFFTNPRAIALTKAKYRYIIARWGYSPSVMAWELFNEVQWTDAIRNGHRDTVAAWHNDMTDFLKMQDPYRHLVTSSFRMDPSELGDRLDYWQPHAYVPDPLTAASSLDGLALDRPAFIGEIGPSGDQVGADERFLHRALWSSLVSESSGTAQFWAWDLIERRNWYRIFRPVTAFMGWSGLAEKRGLKALPLQVEMPENGPLSFAPGAEWEAAGQTEFTVTRSGEVAGIGRMPRFLQGEAHREMFPRAIFHVDFAKPGTFTVHISQVSKGGAKVALSAEAGAPRVREFPAAGADRAEDVTIAIPVPAGPSTVRLENTGPDWAIVDRITLDPYAPALHALGKGSSDYVVAWVYDRAKGAFEKTGRLVIPGLAAGTYDVAWWDTESGRPFGEAKMDVAADGQLVLPSPTLSRDAAVLVRKSGR